MRYVIAAIAVVTCPCHLPILLVLLGGTAAGALLSQHLVWVLLGLTLLFVASAWTALRLFSHDGPDARRTPLMPGRPGRPE